MRSVSSLRWPPHGCPVPGGAPATAVVGVVKRFNWSNADQNAVAKMIAGDHVNPDKAAQKWIAANKAKVNKWLGK